jgi:hypothetical protein
MRQRITPGQHCSASVKAHFSFSASAISAPCGRVFASCSWFAYLVSWSDPDDESANAIEEKE